MVSAPVHGGCTNYASLIRLGVIIFEGLAVFFQLALTRFRELLPGLGHLLKVLAMCGRGGSRHVPAFCSVLKVFV